MNCVIIQKNEGKYMHSIQLKIDDSIFDKVMTMLELLPQDKIKVEDNGYDYPPISKKEAERKVQYAIDHMPKGEGVSLDEAFNKVLSY